jgi:hypothetical protein
MKNVIDSIQEILIKRRNLQRIGTEMPELGEVETFIRRNIEISKTYLPNATGTFKEHLEKVIRDSERLLGNLGRVYELNKQLKVVKTGIIVKDLEWK